ncbi:MAG: SDR family oxidoreductase [Desulfobacterales bacterium]|nr:SDR family oxidoreductase [Desulfobacterales bacterium]
MVERFKGKVAIVTGAGQGIGASHALAFAREGAYVVVADIGQNLPETDYKMSTITEMDQVVNEIEDLGGKALGIKCDVRNADDVEKMVDEVIREFGRIDILVNNAGVAFTATPLWKVTEKNFDLVNDVMFKGTFLCSKYVIPHMISKKYGKIVNTGSISARGQKWNATYSAVKAGIHAFTLAMAKDVGDHNINVNCVAPGNVLTEMSEKAVRDYSRGSVDVDKYFSDACKRAHILGEKILPKDISDTVLFLCSEEARNINGSVIYVDGGYLTI